MAEAFKVNVTSERLVGLRDIEENFLITEFDEIIVSEQQIRARVSELAAQISADYQGRDPLLVCVLKGRGFFMADIVREITVPCELDFMAVSSYGSATDSSGVVRILKDLDANIEGRNVIIIEDIIDSGLTLSYLRRTCMPAIRPASKLRPAHQTITP